MKHCNPAAKALAKPEHRQRVIPDKRDAARRAAHIADMHAANFGVGKDNFARVLTDLLRRGVRVVVADGERDE